MGYIGIWLCKRTYAEVLGVIDFKMVGQQQNTGQQMKQRRQNDNF